MEELIRIIEDLELTDVEISINENTGFLEDLQYFSFEMFTLVAALEEEYDVYLMEHDVRNLVTVGDLYHLLENQGVSFQN